jgi:hypothetical protein
LRCDWRRYQHQHRNGGKKKLSSTAPVDALHHKQTTVTAPDGSKTKHYYNRDWTSPTQWSYKYNTQNQATDETLRLDGQTFELKYGYDSLGNQSTLTYPSGRQISYAPNALGQPTKAGEFATGASYHDNGTLTDFTYGSSLKYNLTLDNRQLLSTLKRSRAQHH